MSRLNTALLFVIAGLLTVIAARDLVRPPAVRAATAQHNFYIEPGTTTLRSPDGKRQVTGKVVVNLDTGDVWGFPTVSSLPYPVDATRSVPPTSSPIYLGKFDFSGIEQEP